jgi:hypothetical protein
MAIDKEEFDGYSVELTQQGPCGSIFYKEQDRALEFPWEYFEKGIIVRVPSPGEWGAFCERNKAEWGKGRRDEILARVGDFYIKRANKGLYNMLFRKKVEGFHEISDRYLTVQTY